MAGYDYNTWRSNNANRAYRDGLVTKSGITQEYLDWFEVGIKKNFAQWLIEQGHWLPKEWHHCSSWYNKVDFFSIADLKDEILSGKINLEHLKKEYEKYRSDMLIPRRIKGEYPVFRRRDGMSVFVKNVPFTGTLEKGWIITDFGMKKRANGKHIKWEIVEESGEQ